MRIKVKMCREIFLTRRSYTSWIPLFSLLKKNRIKFFLIQKRKYRCHPYSRELCFIILLCYILVTFFYVSQIFFLISPLCYKTYLFQKILTCFILLNLMLYLVVNQYVIFVHFSEIRLYFQKYFFV